jgi:ferredoxin
VDDVSETKAGSVVFEVRLVQQGWVFHAPAGQTLLKSAQEAGVHLPRSCQNGTCRTCLCLLVRGQVRHTIDWPGLSPEEKEEGCILPCVACPTSDVVLKVAGASLMLDR